MQRPKDLSNYSQCVKILPDRTIIFCVECDQWHSIEMTGMVRARIGHSGIKEIEIDEEMVELYCSRCSASIEYLLDDRSQIIKKLYRIL